jgi:hypothetical protein
MASVVNTSGSCDVDFTAPSGVMWLRVYMIGENVIVVLSTTHCLAIQFSVTLDGEIDLKEVLLPD